MQVPVFSRVTLKGTTMSIHNIYNARRMGPLGAPAPGRVPRGPELGVTRQSVSPWATDLNSVMQALPTPLSDQLQAGYTAPIRPLPGGLDRTPLLNSNHPEVIRGPGIAVSTFPWPQAAHQNFAFRGPFEMFTHHQNRSSRDLYQAVVLFNASDRPVGVEAFESAAAITRDAPYRDHGPDPVPDPLNQRASGPGDRIAGDILRGKRVITEQKMVLAPGELRIVHTLRLPPSNEGTSAFRFRSDGPVHAAVVLEDAQPSAGDVANRLRSGQLLARNPEDKPPTPPGSNAPFVFGRVAGVQEGAKWQGTITTPGAVDYLIDDQDNQEAFILVGKRTNTLNTGQDHAAPLLTRYPDASYAAHGNYGVTYDLSIPLRNTSARERTVQLFMDSPGGPLPVSRVFRGSIGIDITDSLGNTDTQWVHVSQVAGEVPNTPLTRITLRPGETQNVRIRIAYPANATPPHALRIASSPPNETPTSSRSTLRQWAEATDQALTETLERWRSPRRRTTF
jgi:hypothetical protein